MRWQAAILAGAAALATPAQAVENYNACIALIATDPARAEAEAAQWAALGGGAAAEHCRAQALAAAGSTMRAAELLADLGIGAGDLPDATRVEILIQSAELFLQEGEPDMGLLVIGQSMRIAETPASLVMRARLRADKGEWERVREDLDRAIRLEPTADALALRASARRRAGLLVDARADALWALELDPGDAGAYLELGAIEAALGQKNAARRAFLDAIEADRTGPTAPLARLGLQRLEAGLEPVE